MIKALDAGKILAIAIDLLFIKNSYDVSNPKLQMISPWF